MNGCAGRGGAGEGGWGIFNVGVLLCLCNFAALVRPSSIHPSFRRLDGPTAQSPSGISSPRPSVLSLTHLSHESPERNPTRPAPLHSLKRSGAEHRHPPSHKRHGLDCVMKLRPHKLRCELACQRRGEVWGIKSYHVAWTLSCGGVGRLVDGVCGM